MKKLLPFIFCCTNFFSVPGAYAQTISSVAGDSTAGYSGDGGAAVNAGLAYPQSVATDGRGNTYIGDAGNNRIRKIDATGIMTTYAGTGSAGYNGDGGPALAASLNAQYICADTAGNIYFTDPIYNRVRKISATGIITCVAGTGTTGYTGDGGPATDAQLNLPSGVAVDGNGNVFVADNGNNRVRMISAAGSITTVAGGGTANPGDGGQARAAVLTAPGAISLDAAGNLLVIAGNQVRKMNTDGTITTIAGMVGGNYYGDGRAATASTLMQPVAVAADASGNIYIAELFYHRVRKINTDGILTTYVNTHRQPGYSVDGTAAITALLNTPVGLVASNGDLLIADYHNHRLRCVHNALLASTLVKPDVQRLNVWPNPSHDFCTVTLTSQAGTSGTIRLVNMAGAIIKIYTVSTNIPVAISTNASPGNYLLIAEADGQTSTEQIVIK